MDRYVAQRTALVESAAPGLDSARRLALLTDEAIVRLVGAADPPPGRWCVLAVGGYGAGALTPSSDIDLLVLSDTRPAALRAFVERVLYPLWDAGLDVGHQVRSPKDHLRAAKGDLTILTATLTARTIAGDEGLGAEVVARCAAYAHRSRARVGRELATRSRPGSPYLLEPDLKEGPGGRRDHDELLWRSSLVSGAPARNISPLIDSGLLDAGESTLLESAAVLLAAARWETSLLGERQIMTLDAAGSMSTDAQQVQSALADSAHILQRVRRRMDGATPGLGDMGQEVTEALAGAHLEPADALALLRKGETVLPALEEAVWAGAYDAVMPPLRALMPLRRPGLSHTHTVGAHALKTATLAAAIGTSTNDPSAPTSPSLVRSRAALAEDSALLVAALTHDAGKLTAGPGHAERGVPVARETAGNCGLGRQGIEDAGDLVRLHLLLVETSTSEDLDDDDTILRATERVGRRELIAPLHILSVADSIATGPGAWSPWHEALLASLVSRLDAAFEASGTAKPLAETAEAVRMTALDALSDPSDEKARRFVSTASLRYLAGRDPDGVTRDARLVAELDTNLPADTRIAVRVGPLDGSREVSVVANRRPELMARLAGAISLAGLDILAADVYGAGEQTELEVFVVRSATLAPIEHETWARLERYVRAALADRLELETRLAERRGHYPSRRKVECTVVTDASAGVDTTVLVTAADRVGLLYDIVRAIVSLGLDIRWAKVITAEGVARDAFHVVGPDGQAPTDPGLLGHLAMRIRERA